MDEFPFWAILVVAGQASVAIILFLEWRRRYPRTKNPVVKPVLRDDRPDESAGSE